MSNTPWEPEQYDQKVSFNTRVPDLIEPLRAVRFFKDSPDNDDERHALSSLFHSYLWSEGVNTAYCKKSRTSPPFGGYSGGEDVVLHDPVPSSSCTCGFYGYWDLEFANDDHKRVLLGVVQFWGKMQIGDRGLKAEHAQILGIACVGADHIRRGLQLQYPNTRVYNNFVDLIIDIPTTPLHVIKELLQ